MQLELNMSSTADSSLEPKLESADAGPKLAETETKLATEPIHVDKTTANGADQTGEKGDTASSAKVRHFCASPGSWNMRCRSSQLTAMNTDFFEGCRQCGSLSC